MVWDASLTNRRGGRLSSKDGGAIREIRRTIKGTSTEAGSAPTGMSMSREVDVREEDGPLRMELVGSACDWNRY